EVEVRHGIRRGFLEAGFQCRARLLVLVLFQEILTQRTFLGTLINGGCGHCQVSIESEDYDEYEDLFHLAPLHTRGLLARHNAIDVPVACAAGFEKTFVIIFRITGVSRWRREVRRYRTTAARSQLNPF